MAFDIHRKILLRKRGYYYENEKIDLAADLDYDDITNGYRQCGHRFGFP